MKRPTFIIGGRIVEMPEPKARAWRVWAEFDETKKEIPATEYIEAHCRMIAEIYGAQVTPDELLDELDLADVMKIYHEAVGYITGLLYSKFEELGKNSERGAGDGVI